MNNPEIIIKKASGKTEPFEVEKLKSSLHKAGATDDVISDIVADIENWVYDGVSTRMIYVRAYKMFRQISTSGSLLYKLKMAINSMGPSGYPFEHFIGELFKLQGYEVEVGQVMEGAAITHEMDVIATKGKVQNLIECKFSHKQGNSVGIQVPLYVHSRVDDIVEKMQQNPRYKDVTFAAWLVTNGRFSSDSIEYSRHRGINLLGWDYPKNKALKDLIEKEKMFPLTILSNLNKIEKQKLMKDGIVTCSQLLQQSGILNRMGISRSKQSSIRKELVALDGM